MVADAHQLTTDHHRGKPSRQQRCRLRPAVQRTGPSVLCQPSSSPAHSRTTAARPPSDLPFCVASPTPGPAASAAAPASLLPGSRCGPGAVQTRHTTPSPDRPGLSGACSGACVTVYFHSDVRVTCEARAALSSRCATRSRQTAKPLLGRLGRCQAG